MIPNRLAFNISFPRSPDPVADVWETIVALLRSNRCLPKEFSLSQIAGHPPHLQSERNLFLDASGVRRVIEERNLDGFDVDTGNSRRSIGFGLTNIKNTGNPALVTVRVECKTKTPPTWNRLIEALIIQWPCIGAWQWNTLYRAWQDCSEVKGNTMFFGGLPPGFRLYTKSARNALTNNRQMIDISLNPGRRRQLLPAIHFYPTSEMWLGPHFWQYAKCTREEALAADFFIEKRDTPHFLYLKSWPQPFTRPDGEQGRIQQKLWKLFFHEDCEWPPGSGGISDEAVYGPPELMP